MSRAVAIIGALVTLCGCAASPPVPTAPATSATSSSTTVGRFTAPLTGVAVASASISDRPAVIVKIDNAPPAWPQSGLDRADVVYEELVEGGTTRYLAIFQSRDADPVGPVRSVRETDADIVRPIGGLFAYSGGIPYFVNLIDAAGITDVGANDDAGAYYRSGLRWSPHNLYTSTSVLRQATPSGAGPPPALFSFVAAHRKFSEPGQTRVTQAVVTMSGATVATWTYSSSTHRWDRSTNGVAQFVANGTSLTPGAPVAFTNVIVEEVPYADTGYIDPAGNPVPDADTVGSGSATVLCDGEAVAARWTKSTPSSITTYTADNGVPIQLLPGNTWVMLAPDGASITTS